MLSWPALIKTNSPVLIFSFPKTAVTNIPLNLASTSSLFTPNTTFSIGNFKLVSVLKIEDAFAIYIPALIPFPETSANVKKYSSGVDLTTSK